MSEDDPWYEPRVDDVMRLRNLPTRYSHLTGRTGVVVSLEPPHVVELRLDGRGDTVVVTTHQVQFTGRTAT